MTVPHIFRSDASLYSLPRTKAHLLPSPSWTQQRLFSSPARRWHTDHHTSQSFRVAVAALMEVEEITTMQHVPLTDDMCVHVAVLSCGEYCAMDMSVSMAGVVDANKWRNILICETSAHDVRAVF